MTDQTKAVAALAEATDRLVDLIGGGAPDPQDRYYCKAILRELIANPDILREYGIGRLPTRSELESIWDDDAFVGVRISEMIRLGWAIEDPDPQPEPTLPSVLGRIMYESVKPCLWEGASDYQKTLFIHQAEALLAEFDITLKAPRP